MSKSLIAPTLVVIKGKPIAIHSIIVIGNPSVLLAEIKKSYLLIMLNLSECFNFPL